MTHSITERNGDVTNSITERNGDVTLITERFD